MSYITYYKTNQSISKNSVLLRYNDFYDEKHLLLIDKNDFGFDDKTKIKLDYQSLVSEYHGDMKFKWDRLRDIEILLNNKMYKSALILTLTVPDICSKVLYPEIECIGDRYEKWFNEYIYNYDIGKHGKNGKSFDCVNGFFCYKLRCNLVHGEQIDIDKINNCEKSSFKSKFNYEKTFFKLTDKEYSEIFILEKETGEKYAIILHSVKQLILSIIRAANTFYEEIENKKLFSDGCSVLTFNEYLLF